MSVRVKICGLTRAEDARIAARQGAHFLGVILAESPRGVRVEDAARWIPEVRAEHPDAQWVGVFVRPGVEDVQEACEALDLDLVQIHGLDAEHNVEYPVPWIRAVPHDRWSAHLATIERSRSHARPWAVLADSVSAKHGSGGTGTAFPWDTLRRELDAGTRPERLFLAGGLGPDNVLRAIRRVHPWAVDVSSRLESEPGVKDPEKITAFFGAVSCANAMLSGGSPSGPDSATPHPPRRGRAARSKSPKEPT